MKTEINIDSIQDMTDILQNELGTSLCESDKDWLELSTCVLKFINDSYDLGFRDCKFKEIKK